MRALIFTLNGKKVLECFTTNDILGVCYDILLLMVLIFVTEYYLSFKNCFQLNSLKKCKIIFKKKIQGYVARNVN